METLASKSPHPLVWVASIALIVFCGAGVAALMGWIPTSTSSPGGTVSLATPATSTKPVANPAKAVAVKVPAAPLAAAKCAECGVIQSVREVEAKGEGTGLGAAGGAVVGGVLGHQIGSGNTNKVMTVAGAVGGAVAGNEIEKRDNIYLQILTFCGQAFD